MQILAPAFQLTPVGSPLCPAQNLQVCGAGRQRRTVKAFVLGEELAQFGQIPAMLLHDRLNELYESTDGISNVACQVSPNVLTVWTRSGRASQRTEWISVSSSSAFCGFSMFCRTEIRPTPPCSPHRYCLLPIVAAAAAGGRSFVCAADPKVQTRDLRREATLRTRSWWPKADTVYCNWLKVQPELRCRAYVAMREGVVERMSIRDE